LPECLYSSEKFRGILLHRESSTRRGKALKSTPKKRHRRAGEIVTKLLDMVQAKTKRFMETA
jgi:hypothetical protein